MVCLSVLRPQKFVFGEMDFVLHLLHLINVPIEPVARMTPFSAEESLNFRNHLSHVSYESVMII